ncbi:MAG TPA: hypothetical protein VNX00_04545 [Herbaspirillum sp.]|nr:hypothetical protein [Herbaspirillum sp.]
MKPNFVLVLGVLYATTMSTPFAAKIISNWLATLPKLNENEVAIRNENAPDIWGM